MTMDSRMCLLEKVSNNIDQILKFAQVHGVVRSLLPMQVSSNGSTRFFTTSPLRFFQQSS